MWVSRLANRVQLVDVGGVADATIRLQFQPDSPDLAELGEANADSLGSDQVLVVVEFGAFSKSVSTRSIVRAPRRIARTRAMSCARFQ